MKSSAILQLLAETRPGRCCLCDEPIVRLHKQTGRPLKFCRSTECRRLYQRLYGIDRRGQAEGAGT